MEPLGRDIAEATIAFKKLYLTTPMNKVRETRLTKSHDPVSGRSEGAMIRALGLGVQVLG